MRILSSRSLQGSRAITYLSGDCTRLRLLSLAPRQRLSLLEQEENFGEAPKSAREARALPRTRIVYSRNCVTMARFPKDHEVDLVVTNFAGERTKIWVATTFNFACAMSGQSSSNGMMA